MNMLNEFFNSKSDANKFLNASQQEDLENDFKEFQKSKTYEKLIINEAEKMCAESVSPEILKKWDLVSDTLKKNRGI